MASGEAVSEADDGGGGFLGDGDGREKAEEQRQQ